MIHEQQPPLKRTEKAPAGPFTGPTGPISEEAIRRSTAYQTIKMKATQAFTRLNQRLESLESSFSRQFDKLDEGFGERLKQIENGQSSLQHSFNLMSSWRVQFDTRLEGLEKVTSDLAKSRSLAAGGLDNPRARAARGISRFRWGGNYPVFRLVMAVLGGILMVEVVLFVSSFLQERKSPAPVPVAAIPTVAPELLPSARSIGGRPDPGTGSSAVPSAVPSAPAIFPASRITQREAWSPPRRRHGSARRPGHTGSWEPHQVRKGETWYSLSRRYGIAPRQLMFFNGAGGGRPLRSGEVIRIPGRGSRLGPQDMTLTARPAGRGRMVVRPRSGLQLLGVLKKQEEPPVMATPQAPHLAVNRPAKLY